jgi:hypothetical protein
MTRSLNILRLLGHLLVALERLHDGSVDVSQPLMMFVVHQSSVSTLTDDDGQDAAQVRLRTSANPTDDYDRSDNGTRFENRQLLLLVVLLRRRRGGCV